MQLSVAVAQGLVPERGALYACLQRSEAHQRTKSLLPPPPILLQAATEQAAAALGYAEVPPDEELMALLQQAYNKYPYHRGG